jgi:hypothetical protein
MVLAHRYKVRYQGSAGWIRISLSYWIRIRIPRCKFLSLHIEKRSKYMFQNLLIFFIFHTVSQEMNRQQIK